MAQCNKNLPAIVGDLDSLPGSGRSPGGEERQPTLGILLGNAMDRGAQRVTGHGVTGSQTGLSI